MGRTLDVLEILSGSGTEERLLREAVVRGVVPLETVQNAAEELWRSSSQIDGATLLDHLRATQTLDENALAALARSLHPRLETVDTPAEPTRVRQVERGGEAADPPAAVSPLPPPPDPFDAIPIRDWERYELLEFIGRGGMGDVFKARDPRLDRFVAVKLLRRDDPHVLARFTREAQVQARIEHDNVCPVYEVGQVHGRHFIAMQYVAGGSLKEISDLLEVEEKAAIMAQVADALHAAHRVGLIHRDIKPANIMVERNAEGAWRPYVVDFGIAHDQDSRELTATGAMLGTPAFAAPEQVRGDTQLVDARSDIYSLGATLYWFLTERSPFEGGYPEILAGVTQEDPAPPRRYNPAIPRDLETIILKCLEKEPARRYATARAVAEDLRRFLDGEPIEARRASFAYRLGKRLRKNRTVASVVVVATLIILLLAGQLARARLHAQRIQALAQRFGGQVEEMESIMRTASMMPLHDRSAERARIEDRIHDIEHEMAALGELAEGPGHYALGRAHLALQDTEAAVEHLQTSWDVGYRTPDLSYALGLALGQLYEKRLREIQATTDPAAREAALAAVRRSYRDPALQNLRAGLDPEMESNAYAEALIALYEERYEAGLELARQAIREVPSLFAAKRLEGEVLMTLGDQSAAAGQGSAAIEHYQAAGEAFHAARDIARSDAASYDGDCGRWLRTMDIQIRFGLEADAAYRQALTLCRQSIQIDPNRADPYERVARTHLLWADHLNDTGRDPSSSLRAASEAAQEALRHHPDSFTAHHILGRVATVTALYDAAHGADPRPQLQTAAEHLQRAIELEPGSVQAYDDLGYALEREARYLLSRGTDPRPLLDRAAECYRQAININPEVANPHNNLGIALWRRAVYELRVGGDPRPSLDQAQASLAEAIRCNPNYANAHAMLGFVHSARAQLLLDLEEDPEPEVRAARSSFERAAQLNPGMAWSYPELASVELCAARHHLRRGSSPEAELRAAAAAVERALELNPANAVALQTAAEVHYWKACWLHALGRSARFEIESGRRFVEQALQASPGMATALRTRGALLLAQATQAAGSSRRALAGEAASSLHQALAANPLLERQVKPLLAEAQKIAGS